MTKQELPHVRRQSHELIDAAVAVVEQRATAALEDRSDDHRAGYTEADHVASQLTEAGLISHPGQDARGTAREDAERSLRGKAKRLLDAEAAKHDPRIVRLSSLDHKSLPQLDGQMRQAYGQAVYYTTPELYARAQEAVEARLADERAEAEVMADLLARAATAGLPAPLQSNRTAVTYGRDDLRQLVESAEDRADGIVLAALDGMLENAEEEALSGALRDRALDIAALLVVREMYTVTHGLEGEVAS